MEKEKILQLVATALGDARQATVIVLTTDPVLTDLEPVPAVCEPSPAAARFEPQHSFRKRDNVARKHSRYNFEKNLIMLSLTQPHETTTPVTEWMNTNDLASRIVNILHVTIDTAKNHIARAVAMGIVERKRVANQCFVRIRTEQPATGNEISFLTDEEREQCNATESILPS